MRVVVALLICCVQLGPGPVSVDARTTGGTAGGLGRSRDRGHPRTAARRRGASVSAQGRLHCTTPALLTRCSPPSCHCRNRCHSNAGAGCTAAGWQQRGSRWMERICLCSTETLWTAAHGALNCWLYWWPGSLVSRMPCAFTVPCSTCSAWSACAQRVLTDRPACCSYAADGVSAAGEP